MVLVFDLDDTLYDELDYVKSGFNAVSEWMSRKFGIDRYRSYQGMLNELSLSGRGSIFDSVLKSEGIFSKRRLQECITIYRCHYPQISLNKDAVDCLQRFCDYSMYIVTDGNKVVQYNKIKALGLDKTNFFKKIFITHRYGIMKGKPSPYCFQKICRIEKTDPGNIVYIGDNPAKDFVGIKPLGFKTIRIIQGNHKNIRLDKNHEADLNINSLTELNKDLLAFL